MARRYQHRNRYYRGSKLTETQFVQIVLMFTHGSPASEIASETSVSLRSINELLIRLRRRVFEDATLDPLRQAHGEYGRPPADHPFWQQHRSCLYDCPTLLMEHYPKPVAKSVSTAWHPEGYEEWCGECGVLPARRHPFWMPLEVWSRINKGLPKETYAHHVIYLMLVGYTQILMPMDWQKMILDALSRNPL
jgi:hypothetical protein